MAQQVPIQNLGVDDWAWRKGQNYGTILVDLDRHCVADLLPDRSAVSLTDWLRDHPTEIILAQTLIGRLMGASVTAGAKALAVGAVLAAAGGIMQGAASNIAGTNQAGSAASFQQDIPRPISGTTQQAIISGRAGGAQNPGQASQQHSEPREILIRLDPGLVAQEVAKSSRRNDQRFRVAIEQTAY